MNSPNPYPGPRPFDEDDTGYFFGRNDEAEDIASLVMAHPIVLLVAQSGAGKTSLLNAKVIPRLRDRKCEIFSQGRVSGNLPAGLNADKVKNVYAFNAILTLRKQTPAASTDAASNPQRQPEDPVTQALAVTTASQSNLAAVYGRGKGLTTVRASHPGTPPSEVPPDSEPPPPRVLVFDQFEEIFTSYADRWQEREQFFEQIGDLFDSDDNIRVLIAMREEFLSGLLNFEPLVPEHLRTRYRLEGLTEDAALEAIKNPAAIAGCPFHDDAAAKMIANLLHMPARGDVGEHLLQYVEPLQLQVVCRGLWSSLKPGTKTITANLIGDSKDVEQALAKYFEECLTEIIRTEKVSEPDLRRWFAKKLILPDGTRNLLHPENGFVAGIPIGIVKKLDEKHHLVRSELRGSRQWYELSHDRFVDPIRRSYEDWRTNNDRLGAALETESLKWQKAERPESELWAGAPLKRAQTWLQAQGTNASDLVNEFINAALALQERKRRVRNYVLLGSGIIVAAVIAFSAWFALVNAKRASELRAQQAGFDNLVAVQAQRQLDKIAAEQQRLLATLRGRSEVCFLSGSSAILSTEPRARGDSLRRLAWALDFYPRNTKAASTLADLLLSQKRWARPLTPALHPLDSAVASTGTAAGSTPDSQPGTFVAASFVPGTSGTAVAAISSDGSLTIWSGTNSPKTTLLVPSPKTQTPSNRGSIGIGSLFSNDGTHLLLLLNNLDNSRSRAMAPKTSGTSPNKSLAPADTAKPTEIKLLAWTGTGYSQTIDQLIPPLQGQFRTTQWSPDGNLIAITSMSGRLDTVDTKVFEISGTQLTPVTYESSGSPGQTPTTSGSTILTSIAGGNTAQVTGTANSGNQVMAVGFSPGNETMADVTTAGTVRWWNRSGTGRVNLIKSSRAPVDLGKGSMVNALAADPNGRWYASVWSAPCEIIETNNDHHGLNPGDTDGFLRVCFSSGTDSQQLGVRMMFNRAYVAPLADFEDSARLSEPICYPGHFGIAIPSEDGKRLLILSGPLFNAMDTLQVWDVSAFRSPMPDSSSPPPSTITGDAPDWLSKLAHVVGGESDFTVNSFPLFQEEIGKDPDSGIEKPLKEIWRRYFTSGLPAGPVPPDPSSSLPASVPAESRASTAVGY